MFQLLQKYFGTIIKQELHSEMKVYTTEFIKLLVTNDISDKS
nr:hypothetical protein [Mycoplasmopsis bovis]